MIAAGIESTPQNPAHQTGSCGGTLQKMNINAPFPRDLFSYQQPNRLHQKQQSP
jgi:hypothetical protein